MTVVVLKNVLEHFFNWSKSRFSKSADDWRIFDKFYHKLESWKTPDVGIFLNATKNFSSVLKIQNVSIIINY